MTSKMLALPNWLSNQPSTFGLTPSILSLQLLRKRSVICISNCSPLSMKKTELQSLNSPPLVTSPVWIFSSTRTSKKTSKTVWTKMWLTIQTSGQRPSSRTIPHLKTGLTLKRSMWLPLQVLWFRLTVKRKKCALPRVPASPVTAALLPSLAFTKHTKCTWTTYSQRRLRCTPRRCLINSMKPTSL